MSAFIIREILNKKAIKNNVEIIGWVKTLRSSGKIAFLEINDGSSVNNLQVVLKQETTKNFQEITNTKTGAAVNVIGKIVFNSKQKTNELACQKFTLLKNCVEDYPLQKKEHSFEFLREIAHLRPRTTTIGAIMRVRNALAFAVHKFFQENEYMWVATPILTSNDAEGAGENFSVNNIIGKKPFFDKQASLTVSGQLNVEAYAQTFKKVYTFGPTFRAERSHTNRHMAEFWMIEPEIAFANLSDLQKVIESFIKYIVKYVYTICLQEINFFAKTKPHILTRIKNMINKKFIRVDYAKGIELLKKAIKNGHKFEDNNIYFGKDLGSEHERYLCEKEFNSPIFLQNYPLEIKAFYMKENDATKTYCGKDLKGVSGKTVAANDLLVPGVGEIVGGSQREDDYDKLMKRVKDLKIDVKTIQWYLDLRKYGYYRSAGFGLGFERLLMYILDIENIRDTIPYPRSEGKLNF